jgi:hypothetical protein
MCGLSSLASQVLLKTPSAPLIVCHGVATRRGVSRRDLVAALPALTPLRSTQPWQQQQQQAGLLTEQRCHLQYCRPSNWRTPYVGISEITNEIWWFRNFRPQWRYVTGAVLTVNYQSGRYAADTDACSVFADTRVEAVVSCSFLIWIVDLLYLSEIY